MRLLSTSEAPPPRKVRFPESPSKDEEPGDGAMTSGDLISPLSSRERVSNAGFSSISQPSCRSPEWLLLQGSVLQSGPLPALRTGPRVEQLGELFPDFERKFPAPLAAIPAIDVTPSAAPNTSRSAPCTPTIEHGVGYPSSDESSLPMRARSSCRPRTLRIFELDERRVTEFMLANRATQFSTLGARSLTDGGDGSARQSVKDPPSLSLKPRLLVASSEDVYSPAPGPGSSRAVPATLLDQPRRVTFETQPQPRCATRHAQTDAPELLFPRRTSLLLEDAFMARTSSVSSSRHRRRTTYPPILLESEPVQQLAGEADSNPVDKDVQATVATLERVKRAVGDIEMSVGVKVGVFDPVSSLDGSMSTSMILRFRARTCEAVTELALATVFFVAASICFLLAFEHEASFRLIVVGQFVAGIGFLREQVCVLRFVKAAKQRFDDDGLLFPPFSSLPAALRWVYPVNWFLSKPVVLRVWPVHCKV
jgi:hypothetical protein